MKKLIYIVLILILFYTRFVNLGWGLPYPMHPDERNMAVAVQSMNCDIKFQVTSYKLQECFNPHFFAYGQLPLYIAYGGIGLFHLFTGQATQPTFIEATIALRTISAFSSIALVLALLKIIELLVPKKRPFPFGFQLLAFSFLIFQPYAIQLSHFGTTESLLMLFYSLIIYFSLRFWAGARPASTALFLGLFSGLALGTKISSVLFLGVPVLVIIFKIAGGKIEGARHARKRFGQQAIEAFEHWREVINFDGICKKLLNLLVYLVVTLIFFILSSPQSFLNWAEFITSMNYESGVGLGTYLPFYTRQFAGTVPVLFQFEKILPYVLGWPTLIGGILGLFLLPSTMGGVLRLIFQVARLKKQKNILSELPEGHKDIRHEAIVLDIIRFSLLLSFLPSSFFFAKWTRFIAPSFPLFSLFAILFYEKIFQQVSRFPSASSGRDKFQALKYVVIVAAILPGVSYLSIYTSPDIRFTASDWIYKNIPANSKILSETANVIDLPIPIPYSLPPMPSYFVNSFNFYDLDANPQLQQDLAKATQEADYIIVPSRRIFKNHTATNYALLTTYYSDLFSGRSGYEKVAEFSSFPRLEFQVSSFKFHIPFPDEEAEETWTVFDHPVIRVYKRSQQSTVDSQQQRQSILDFSQYQTVSYRLSSADYRLLLADTPEKWEKGLMYVKNKSDIGGLDGMIFIFPTSEIKSFWNKNTLSHLTLYWIHNKIILGTSDMPSVTESGTIQTFSSPAPADTVIEIIE